MNTARVTLSQSTVSTGGHTEWPEWNEETEDIPEEFEGTLDCPACWQSWLVMGYHDKPFCFHCNTSIDVDVCDDCGETFLVKQGCGCGKQRGEDHERFEDLLDQMRGREIRERETRHRRTG